MRNLFCRVALSIAGACAAIMPCWAQAHGRPIANPAPAFAASNLGKAYVAIDGPWAFHPGDNPAWSAPDFDDANWARIETDSSWEGQGFRNLTGFAWYRRRIVLADEPTEPNWQPALVLPAVEDAAEIYWNGRLLGSYGKLPPDPVWYDWAGSGAPEISPHFPAFVPLGPSRSGVLAIRVWKAPYIYYSFPAEGGLVAAPLLGSAAALAARDVAVWYRWLRANLWQLGIALLSGLVSLLALLAWLRNRNQRMLLWLALYTIHPLALLLTGTVFGIPGLLDFRWSYGLIAPIICVEDIALWFLLLYLLDLRSNPRLVRWTWWMAAISVYGNFGDGALQLFQWTAWPDHLFLALDVGITIPALLVEAWGVVLVLFAFKRRLDAARWFLAIVAVLTDFSQALGNWFSLGMRWTHWDFWMPFQRPLFSVLDNQFDAQSILNTLLLAAIVYAVWRYQAEQAQRQNALEQEYRSAQELQQVLIPDAIPALPCYAVSSVYRPAQEVGGDFFQIIPLEGGSAGAALIVLGDVSGKGLPAAMAVALLVGAIRSTVEISSEPAAILAALNRRLHGRLRGGFATCLALRLDKDGACVLANAGHLAPYLNGTEMDVDFGLPLGLAQDAEYAETRLRLEPADTLTMLSDGVVEARNAAGELFGFERTAGISTQPAESIAGAAQRFGQQDDITVLTLTFAPVEVAHA